MTLEEKRIEMKKNVIQYRKYILKKLHGIIQHSFRGNYDEISIEFVEAELYQHFDGMLKYYDHEKSGVMHFFNLFVIPSFKEHLYGVLNGDIERHESSLDELTEKLESKGISNPDIDIYIDDDIIFEKYEPSINIDVENVYEFLYNSETLDNKEKEFLTEYYGFNDDKKVLREYAEKEKVSISTIYARLQKIYGKLKKEIENK